MAVLRARMLMLCFGAVAAAPAMSHPTVTRQDFMHRITGRDVFSGVSDDGQPRGDIFIEVLSRPRSCTIKANGKTVLYVDKLDATPPPDSFYHSHMVMDGTYVVSLHPTSGELTGQAHASGHLPNAAFFAMEEFLQNVQTGRLVVFCTLSETSFSLDSHAERLFRALNSSYMPDMQIRSMLALVAVSGGPVLAEGYALNLDSLDAGHPGHPLRLTATVPAVSSDEAVCNALKMPGHRERREFCQKHDGYRGMCDCENPAPLRYPTKPFENGELFKFPIIILASNRPQYLLRCLTSLLPVRGLDLTRVVVFVDGDYPEVRQLLAMLGVRLHQHVIDMAGLSSHTVGTRIGYHYRYTMEKAFNMFPDAEKIVLLEEDLEVSPDFISYFQQTHHLLDEDVSLYCISAWNDHGYNHTVGDPAMLYRVGFLPGLGWMLKRSLFFDELVTIWPNNWKTFDWDVLLRLPSIRRGRDCIIPDVSRTYHFGFVGNHVHAGMQFAFFYDHALNANPDVKLKDVDKMVYPKYQHLLQELVRNATVLDGSQTNTTSCTRIIPSDTKNETYLLFLRVYGPDDMEPWATVATCLNLWDLDTRGDHNGLWRFWYNGNHILVMGVPYSGLSGAAVNSKDKMTIFAGKRSRKIREQGRWPPTMYRDKPEDRKQRYRLAERAFGILPGDIREVTENTRRA